MKKLTSLISCLVLLCLIGCNTSSGGSGNPDDNSEETAFKILNLYNQELTFWVGTIPKSGNSYDKSRITKQSVLVDKRVPVNGTIMVPSYPLEKNEAYCVVCNNLYWVVEKDSYLAVFYSGDNNQLWLRPFNGGKGKIENTGEPDIWPLKITNNYDEPITVCLGDVSFTNNGYDWDNGNWYTFLNQTFLKQGESITVYGKLTGDKSFFIHGWPLSGGGSGWGISTGYNEVYFIKTNNNVLGINYKFNPSVNLENQKDDLQPLETINQTFDSTLDSNMWITGGISTGIVSDESSLKQYPQYGDALIELNPHGKTFKLATYEKNKGNGNSLLSIAKISVTQESALSFDYKCDLLKYYDTEHNKEYINYFRIYLDNSETPVFEADGSNQPWKNASVILTAGTHSVTFVTESCGSMNGYLTNAVYLDNITLAPNTVASVDIYPKGLQETYVNGDKIQFTANALRADGSVIADKSVTWSTNGGTIDNNGLFSPGTTSGDFTVTATIDGKTASNTTVKVHGKNYLNDPVTINGHTFTGQITDGSVGLDPNGNITTNIKLDFSASPQFSNFTTDGFFVLKGTATNTDVVVTVRKKMPEDDTSTSVSYKYYTIYKIKAGDFNQRIWLRYGDGEYEILIGEVTFDAVNDYDGYECAISNWSSNGDINTREFLTVINKTGLNYSEDDSAYLMPSYICPSDAFVVSNGFNAVMAEMPENASVGQKLRALYDWVINLCHYDYVSLGDDIENPTSDKRKRQEAPYVINYQMAVCEGYANLYTALARLAGVKTAYQSSMQLNHAWTECYYKGEWKMVDATWDDPSDTTVTVSIPNAGNYNYFLIDRKDSSHAGKDGSLDNVTDYSRHADTSSGANYLPDMRY